MAFSVAIFYCNAAGQEVIAYGDCACPRTNHLLEPLRNQGDDGAELPMSAAKADRLAPIFGRQLFTFGELGNTTFLRQCFSQYLQNIAGGFLSRFYRLPGGSIDALDGPPGMIDGPGGEIAFCGKNHTGEHNSELFCESPLPCVRSGAYPPDEIFDQRLYSSFELIKVCLDQGNKIRLQGYAIIVGQRGFDCSSMAGCSTFTIFCPVQAIENPIFFALPDPDVDVSNAFTRSPHVSDRFIFQRTFTRRDRQKAPRGLDHLPFSPIILVDDFATSPRHRECDFTNVFASLLTGSFGGSFFIKDNHKIVASEAKLVETRAAKIVCCDIIFASPCENRLASPPH